MVLLSPTDIKQYMYCPRLVYYKYCMGVEGYQTHKMKLGIKAEAIISGLEKRRLPVRYNLASAKKLFDVALVSETLGLTGRVDMLLDADTLVVPVDFKNSGRISDGMKYQLTAYALLAEEAKKKPVPFGFIYLLTANELFEVVFDDGLKSEVRAVIAAVRLMVRDQNIPVASTVMARCEECTLRNFCGDIFYADDE